MNQPFCYRDGVLCVEQVSLEDIAAEHGTPTYVYSRRGIESRYRAIESSLAAVPHLVCYAVKANSNLAVLDVLARIGAGFDIVSAGELRRVVAAGGECGRVVFSGVGKQRHEMREALAAGVRCFNVESEAELVVLSQVASELGRPAPVSLRVNPDVDARTHPYISTGLKENKFGVPIQEAEALYRRAARLPGLDVQGIDCHIGSQLTDPQPHLDALERLLGLVERLAGAGIHLRHLDMGGGMGIAYGDEQPPGPEVVVGELARRMQGLGLELLVEPGRAVVGECGALLTRVLYHKRNGEKNFLVADAAMNDLIRPALYQGWQPVWPVRQAPPDAPAALADLVGPVCESADFLALDRELAAGAGDLLAVGCAGAYGFVMSSNYNSRPRAAEILVDGDRCHVARERESMQELFRLEHRLPEDGHQPGA